MKRYTYILLTLFLALIAYASTDFLHGIVGLTKLNGDGCVCHSLDPEPSVSVSVIGPTQLTPNQIANYTIRVTGGAATVAGFNVAARFGTVNPIDTSVRKIDTEITHNNPKPFSNDSVKWNFSYKAPAQTGSDTIYSVSLSANGDGAPSFLDKWNFGNNFPVTILNEVPVELISFSSAIVDQKVVLQWRTSSEKNNFGFEIERAIYQQHSTDRNWNVIGFVKGNGTTTNFHDYKFVDANVSGSFSYRLKQIDFDGKFEYSNIVEVNNNLLSSFSLEQNFPNPFNPSTSIRFANPSPGKIIFKVYDLKGEEVETIAENFYEEGNFAVDWNAGKLTSGVYVIQANHNELKITKSIKVVLSK